MSDDNAIHQITAPIFLAIGHVAHHWARLEYEVNRLIWAFSRLTPLDGACITSQIPAILPRFRAVISLARQYECSKGVIDDLNRFASEADKLARRRNRIVHDPWFVRVDETKTSVQFGHLEITADRKLSFGIKTKSPKDVLDIAHQIIGARTQFIQLRSRICDELPWLSEALQNTDFGSSQDYQPQETETQKP